MSLTTSSRVSIFILFLASFFPLSWTVEESSLEKILRNHGLPAGLFPRSVKSFKFDQMGYLEVHLDHPCLAQYETTVFFDTIVKANLSFRQLQVLEGMSREELFLWLPVKDIFVADPSSGVILIDIGFALKFLAFSRFDEPPICRSHLGTFFSLSFLTPQLWVLNLFK